MNQAKFKPRREAPRAIQLLEDAERAERKTDAAGLPIITYPAPAPIRVDVPNRSFE